MDRLAWPISFTDVLDAERRLRVHLSPTPLRNYPLLDEATGLRVLVKHENYQPTGAFKVRNGLSVMTGISQVESVRGVIGASMGNYGQGLAWAGQRLGVSTTICVPHGVTPDKLAAIRGFGAELVEEGRDFDESLEVMERLVQQRGLYAAHGVNHPLVPAGAATIALEILQQADKLGESLDALVIVVGGGSQAVGAMTVLRERRPDVKVFGVQATGAPTIHNAWHQRKPLVGEPPTTFAEGIATRQTYELTFPALCAALSDFVLVTDDEMAAAMRLIWKTTHNMVEPAGAGSVAALAQLHDRLRGQTVAVIFSGCNVDLETLRRVIG